MNWGEAGGEDYLCFFFLRDSGLGAVSTGLSGSAGCQARGFLLYMGHGGRVSWREKGGKY